MSKEEFAKSIKEGIKACPSKWRYGQSVFNYIDDKYGNLARYVQFNKGVDCFYNDDIVDKFIETCYNELNEDKDE